MFGVVTVAFIRSVGFYVFGSIISVIVPRLSAFVVSRIFTPPIGEMEQAGSWCNGMRNIVTVEFRGSYLDVSFGNLPKKVRWLPSSYQWREFERGFLSQC